VTYRSPQVGWRVALDNDSVEPQSGHLNFANHIAYYQDVRFREEARLLEFFHFEGLIHMRISEDKAGVAQGEYAERQEKVAGATEDVRSGWRDCSRLVRQEIHFVPNRDCTVGCLSALGE
jgi:hypothetical protein